MEFLNFPSSSNSSSSNVSRSSSRDHSLSLTKSSQKTSPNSDLLERGTTSSLSDTINRNDTPTEDPKSNESQSTSKPSFKDPCQISISCSSLKSSSSTSSSSCFITPPSISSSTSCTSLNNHVNTVIIDKESKDNDDDYYVHSKEDTVTSIKTLIQDSITHSAPSNLVKEIANEINPPQINARCSQVNECNFLEKEHQTHTNNNLILFDSAEQENNDVLQSTTNDSSLHRMCEAYKARTNVNGLSTNYKENDIECDEDNDKKISDMWETTYVYCFLYLYRDFLKKGPFNIFTIEEFENCIYSNEETELMKSILLSFLYNLNIYSGKSRFAKDMQRALNKVSLEREQETRTEQEFNNELETNIRIEEEIQSQFDDSKLLNDVSDIEDKLPFRHETPCSLEEMISSKDVRNTLPESVSIVRDRNSEEVVILETRISLNTYSPANNIQEGKDIENIADYALELHDSQQEEVEPKEASPKVAFYSFDPKTKIGILKTLVDWQLIKCDALRKYIEENYYKNQDLNPLKVEPLGYDEAGNKIYKLPGDEDHVRLYKDNSSQLSQANLDNHHQVEWRLLTRSVEDLRSFCQSLNQNNFNENELFIILSETVIPKAEQCRLDKKRRQARQEILQKIWKEVPVFKTRLRARPTTRVDYRDQSKSPSPSRYQKEEPTTDHFHARRSARNLGIRNEGLQDLVSFEKTVNHVQKSDVWQPTEFARITRSRVSRMRTEEMHFEREERQLERGNEKLLAPSNVQIEIVIPSFPAPVKKRMKIGRHRTVDVYVLEAAN